MNPVDNDQRKAENKALESGKRADSGESGPSFDEVVGKMLNTPPKPKAAAPQPAKKKSGIAKTPRK